MIRKTIYFNLFFLLVFSFLKAQNQYVFFDKKNNNSEKNIKKESMSFKIKNEFFYVKNINETKLIGPYFFKSINFRTIEDLYKERNIIRNDKSVKNKEKVYKMIYIVEKNDDVLGFYNLYKTDWLVFFNIKEKIIHCE